MQNIEQKIDLLLEHAEQQKQWNEQQKEWDSKIIQKIDKAFQWMEMINGTIATLRHDLEEFKLYQFQKNDELFEIVIEMRDDLRMLKRIVSIHEDSFTEFKKHLEDKTRHLST